MDPSVPFHAEYTRMVPGGWIGAHVSGIVSLQAAGLVLQTRERQDRVALTEHPGSGAWTQAEGATTTTVIPLEALAGVRLRGGRITPPRLVVEVQRLELLDGFSWARGTRLTLSVRWADRQAARELALATDMALVDRQLARLESPDASPPA